MNKVNKIKIEGMNSIFHKVGEDRWEKTVVLYKMCLLPSGRIIFKLEGVEQILWRL